MANKDPEEVICICSSCGTEQRTDRVEKSPFLKNGQAHPCSYCGGVCILVERRDAKNALAQIRAQRGL